MCVLLGLSLCMCHMQCMWLCGCVCDLGCACVHVPVCMCMLRQWVGGKQQPYRCTTVTYCSARCAQPLAYSLMQLWHRTPGPHSWHPSCLTVPLPYHAVLCCGDCRLHALKLCA
jgi:hypothetical protein